MNKILIFIFLCFSLNTFAQVPIDAEEESEAPFIEENYEQDMFIQKQEAITDPAVIPEDFQIEEEVYDADIDYSEY